MGKSRRPKTARRQCFPQPVSAHAVMLHFSSSLPAGSCFPRQVQPSMKAGHQVKNKKFLWQYRAWLWFLPCLKPAGFVLPRRHPCLGRLHAASPRAAGSLGMGAVPCPLPSNVKQCCTYKPATVLWVSCPSGSLPNTPRDAGQTRLRPGSGMRHSLGGMPWAACPRAAGQAPGRAFPV